jgi:hypothetical protein
MAASVTLGYGVLHVDTPNTRTQLFLTAALTE